jgi:hypothetical protein
VHFGYGVRKLTRLSSGTFAVSDSDADLVPGDGAAATDAAAAAAATNGPPELGILAVEEGPNPEAVAAAAAAAAEPFDVVIVATPLELAGITLVNVDMAPLPPRKYRTTVTTYIKVSHLRNHRKAYNMLANVDAALLPPQKCRTSVQPTSR